jgi:hypothetical protein
LFVAVVSLLLWGLWLIFFSPRVSLVSLRVFEYERVFLPPVPFSQADFEALGVAGLESRDLPDRTKGAIEADLTKRMQAVVGRPTQDSLVLFVSAHGISIGGRGYLLFRDFLKDYTPSGLSEQGNCLEIGQFLNLISKCQARHKIVVLDAGHLPTAPHLGVLVNEFPSLLKAEVAQTHDEGLWVLSANSMHEYSHVSYPQHRTVFSYFFVRGLAGDADLHPQDKRLDLAELASFVGWGTSEWVRRVSDDQESQTPQIYWGGGNATTSDLAKRMSQVALPIKKAKPSSEVANSQVPAGAAPPADAKPPDSKPTDTKPGDTKPDDTKPDDIKPTGTKSAGKVAAASPRFAAPDRGRMPGQGHLSLATLALAQQPGGEPAAAKNPSTDPAPAAAPGAAEKKDASQAPAPAADPASKAAPETKGATPPAAAGEQKPAAGSPPENAAPKPGDGTKAAGPPAYKGPLKWVDEAWKDQDDWKGWAGLESWGPRDYAPHLWREFEQVIINYELRRRAWLGATESQTLKHLLDEFATAKEKAKSDVKSAMSEFARSSALKTLSRSDDDSKLIREAVQERNACLYRAVDLVAWHARATCGSKTNPSSEGIDAFLRALSDFEKSLDDLVAKPLDDAQRASHRVRFKTELDALRTARRAIDDRIDLEVELLVKAPATPGAARRIEALLATSLIKLPARIKLLGLLDPQANDSATAPAGSRESRDSKSDRVAAGKELDQWLDDNKPGLPQLQALDLFQRLESAAESQAALAGPWDSAAVHAGLEVQLARLANHDFGTGLAKQFDHNAIRELGGQLAGFYLQLPKDISDHMAKADLSQLRDLDRKLRLVPAAGAFQLLGRSPIPELSWSLREIPGVVFVESKAPDNLVLKDNTSEWTELKISLAAAGGYAGRVKIALDYKKDLLRIKKNPEDDVFVEPRVDDKPLKFPASGPLELNYFIQPVRRVQVDAYLTVSATAADQSVQTTSRRIRCSVPPPDDVELVVSMIDASSARLALPRRRQASDWVQRLFTFSGHKTPFIFQLKHQAKRDRKVSVELFAVKEEADRETVLDLLRRPDTRPTQLAREGVVRLAEAEEGGGKEMTPKQMTLPKNGEPKPIPFKELAARPADAKAAPAGKADAAPKAEGAPKPVISGGLVCVVRDQEKPSLGPWLTWIEISPWQPRDFIEPRVSYSRANKELSVELGLRENAPFPQDGEPVKIALNFPPAAKAKIRVVRPEALLTNERRKVAPLKAINLAADQVWSLELRLDVDGFPRAFVFEEFVLNQDHADVHRRNDLKRVEIFAPKRDTAITTDESRMIRLPVEIRVDAPDDAFALDPSDRVDLVVAKRDDDAELLPKVILSRLGPRQVDLRLDKVDTDGSVTIDTATSDFRTKLELGPHTDQVNLKAQLIANGTETLDTVPIVLDNTPPQITYAGPVGDVYKGDTATIEVKVTDEGSGPKSAEFVVDKNENGQIDKEEESVKSSEEISGTFDLKWKTKDLEPGVYQLLVWATDQAGLKSYGDDREPLVVRVNVKQRPEKKPDAPNAKMATTGSIKGQVLYVKQPVANAKVSIVEGTGLARVVKKSATTDGDGRFELKDLQPGDYTLQAEGRAKNKQRKSRDTAATVPTPPVTVTVTVPLE